MCKMFDRFPLQTRPDEADEGPMDQPSDGSGDKKEPPSSNQDERVPMHPLVKKLVPDPDDPPDTVVLVGYLGSSSKQGFVRIYLDLNFLTYYELLASDVLHAEKVDPHHEDAPTKIIVDATAKLNLVQILEASFLQGSIAAAYPVSSSFGVSFSPIGAGKSGACSGNPNTYGCPPTQTYGQAPSPCSGSNPHTYGCPPTQTYGQAHGTCSGSNPHTYGCPPTQTYGQAPSPCSGSNPHTYGCPPTQTYGQAHGTCSGSNPHTYGCPPAQTYARPLNQCSGNPNTYGEPPY